MRENSHQAEAIPAEIQEVMRAVVSAIRAVRLYPSNNPIYSISVKKSFEILDRCLHRLPECRLGVQKNAFAFGHATVGGDPQLFQGIAHDLFMKGIREISFTQGITESELLNFYIIVSQPLEALRLKNNIESLIWEKGFSHIAIKGAALDEVVLLDHDAQASAGEVLTAPVSGGERDEEYLKDKGIDILGNRVALTDLVHDPHRFGSMMIETAKKGAGSREQQMDTLFDLYLKAGRQVLLSLSEKRGTLFNALAESILAMDSSYKEGLIARRLYDDMDRRSLYGWEADALERLPNELYELFSARFSKSWTVPQVSRLLVKVSTTMPPSEPPVSEKQFQPRDLAAIAREMSEYAPDEMERLKTISDFGVEPDTLEAVVRTLINLLPFVQNPVVPAPRDKTLSKFSDILSQLEALLALLLEKKEYVLASLVLHAFRMPADPPFRPRLAEAIKRSGERMTLTRLIDNIRSFPADSPEYQAVYTYLSLLDREATPVLLEILAEEEDRSARKLLIRILKDLGKDQIAMLGERLSDERWYFVRNIVNILGESRKEEGVAFLERVAAHKNFQIRQEVVRALVSIGGPKATGLLVRFLNDKDIDIRFMALRGLGAVSAASHKGEQALIAFLRGRWLRKTSLELKREAIESLGKVGGADALLFLVKFARVKWWKARKPQEELRAASHRALHEIERRLNDAGKRH
jgi:HEAT repeat protein